MVVVVDVVEEFCAFVFLFLLIATVTNKVLHTGAPSFLDSASFGVKSD